MDPALIKKIRQLVSEGRLDEALDLLDEDSADSHILSLKSRLQLLQQKKLRGTITSVDETIETNSIVDSLLGWIDELNDFSKESDLNPDTHKVDDELILLIKDKLSDSLSFYYGVSLIPIIAAVALASFFYLDNGMDALEGIGSALIASISGFPIREIINRRDRISFLEILLLRINNLDNKYEIQKVNNLSWSIIESTILKTQSDG